MLAGVCTQHNIEEISLPVKQKLNQLKGAKCDKGLIFKLLPKHFEPPSVRRLFPDIEWRK